MATTTDAAPQFPRALHELESEFAQLADQIDESPEKRALSVLHGIVMEVWRNIERDRSPLRDGGLTLDDVAGMWQTAPDMDGAAQNPGLPAGTAAPDFELPDASGTPVRLSDFRGRPVVLAFYPLDWSPGCSQQLDLYQQEIDEFERRGAQLLAVSIDSVYSHGAWAAVRGLSFPLLADFAPKGEIARRYDVWRDRDGFSERALYVVDADGVIRYSHVSPQLGHIPDIYELFDAVDAAARGENAERREPVAA